MSLLENLRERILRRHEDIDPMLYLSARMRDAEDDSRKWMQYAEATERAAVSIIGRYGNDAVREFYRERDLIKEHMK